MIIQQSGFHTVSEKDNSREHRATTVCVCVLVENTFMLCCMICLRSVYTDCFVCFRAHSLAISEDRPPRPNYLTQTTAAIMHRGQPGFLWRVCVSVSASGEAMCLFRT